MYGQDNQELVGKKITGIAMNTDYLRFDTDQGPVVYTVEGDCCSVSYFYDFFGVKKLLANGPVVSVRSIDLADPEDADARRGDSVVAYGYEIVTEHPTWGEQTSVVSFRNDSNGYYGGQMYAIEGDVEVDRKLTDDCLGTDRFEGWDEDDA